MWTARSSRAATILRSVQRNAPIIHSRTITASVQVADRQWVSSFRPHRAHSALYQRQFSTNPALRKEEPPNPSGIAPAKQYSFQEIEDLITNPSPNKILIDVREPSELLQTGRIPTAQSVPVSSAPDAFFMNPEDFEDKFGFPRPGSNDEVIFYCKAGVRSRQAGLLAAQAQPSFGGKVGNYGGSWLDWEKNGGKVEREGDQGAQSTLSGVTGGNHGTPRP